ncbi:hypothetical protein [Crassaminicella profunda]|uniref:hypothetical protein n=1 Tax=Crassaminicella profunda TaxID=1286698 RepID=UPI001CA6AA9D|nr:hypothetical protein [Crassaminicella profunda]QZY54315.1 hypothetical protein K7H06_14865 [Crassaminicella profunda]
MDLEKQVDEIIDNIFKYKIDIAIEQTITIIEEIMNDIENTISMDQNRFEDIMNYINIALQNKDYLFLADLLKYELMLSIKKQGVLQ